MNTAPGYDDFSYLGIFCVGKVPSLLKFMQKMNPSKWYIWSMLLYLSIFFYPACEHLDVCLQYYVQIFVHFLMRIVWYALLSKKFWRICFFFQNETQKAAYIHITFTPDVSSLSLSLSPGKWGGKSYTFCILSDLLFSLSRLFCFWYPLLFTDTYCIFKQFKLIQLVLFHCLENILQFSPAIYTTWGIHIIDTGCDSCSYFLCV